MPDLRVNVTGSGSGFKRVLDEAKVQAKGFSDTLAHQTTSAWAGIGKSLAGWTAGGLGVGVLVDQISKVFERAKDIKETADNFDLTTDAVQKWERAMAKAGITQTVFYRSLETLRAKRAEARQDTTKLGIFSDMGLGPEALGTDVSDEELLRRVVASGAPRVLINELLGRRGATLKGALPHLGASAAFTEADIERMSQTRENAEGFGRTAKGVFGGAVAGFTGLFTKEGRHRIFGNQHQIIEEDRARQQAAAEQERIDAERDKSALEAARQRELKVAQDKKDIELQGKAFEFKEKMESAQDRLNEAEQRNMTIGDRRLSIEKRLHETKSQMANLEMYLSEFGDDRAAQLRMVQLKTEAQGLKTDLREKPLSFRADNLAHVGLFTASSLAFNPLLGIQQQQLKVLHRIANNTAHPSDPHRP